MHTGKLFFLMNGYKPLKYTTITHQRQKKNVKNMFTNTSQTWNGISKDIFFKAIYSSETDGQVSKIVLLVDIFGWVNIYYDLQ